MLGLLTLHAGDPPGIAPMGPFWNSSCRSPRPPVTQESRVMCSPRPTCETGPTHDPRSYPSSVRSGGRSSCPTATHSSLEEELAPG